MEVAQRYQDHLAEIKENVKSAYEAFRHNYDRFNEFRKFVFETSYTSDDVALLNDLSKPSIEFNITEAYISRLLGEFSKQEPSVAVSADNEDKADPLVVHVVEQHIRHVLLDSKNHHAKYEVIKDTYSGGFSAFKVWTDYKNPMSFDQDIMFDRVYDPTLVGFDPLARYSHKGDGRFCFELFPYDKETFESENPKIDISKVDFNSGFSGFNWAYTDGNIKTILVCDYYKKKKKDIKIVQLQDGSVLPLKDYEEKISNWNGIDQPPAIMGNPRWTTIETICRYRCIENQVIEYKETDYTFFPLVYVDGNSIILKDPKSSGNSRQFTRPYVYHAMGAQKLKNFAGVSLANELENIVQHKFMVAKEALPKEMDFLNAYKDIQKASTLVYNAYFDQNADQPIANPIREIARVGPPPELMQTFSSTDSLLQNILGSYDASLGINDNQLSGIAIVESATQSNAAAMPYIVGYLQGLSRVAEIIVDLIPKYYTLPRSIPIMGVDNKAQNVKINTPDGIKLDYEPTDLNVKVEAGVSFQIQKSRALQQMIALMQASPAFAQFINDEGLPVLLDNIEIRGIDQLKQSVGKWTQQQQQQKQQAMQMQQQQMQNNPMVMKNQIEQQKLQQSAQKDQTQFSIDMQKLRTDQMKALSDAMIAHDTNQVQLVKAQTERFSKQAELDLKHMDMRHNHAKDIVDRSIDNQVS